MQAISPQQKNELLTSYLNLQKRSIEYVLTKLRNDIEVMQRQIQAKESELQSITARIQDIQTHQ